MRVMFRGERQTAQVLYSDRKRFIRLVPSQSSTIAPYSNKEPLSNFRKSSAPAPLYSKKC